MQNAATVLDAQPRAIAEWSLESPVIGNGHAGFYVQRPIMCNPASVARAFPAQRDLGWPGSCA